jgi:hypothetical protein
MSDLDFEKPNTFYLFAKPSFIEGIARLLDFGGTLNIYNESGTGAEADVKALKNDWEAVGQDIQTAIISYGQKQKKPETYNTAATSVS